MKYFKKFFVEKTAIVLLILAGCDASALKDGTANLTLNLNAHVNGKSFSGESSATYDVKGIAMSFKSARMYISEISLISSDDTRVAVESEPLEVPAKNDENENISHIIRDHVLLVKHDAKMTAYDIGTWPAGEYKGIRFKVGIAGTTNRIDPSQVPAKHPLSKQTDFNNHWNWNAGYLFLRMDGRVDTNNDEKPDSLWAVHLGTAKFLKEVTLTHNFTLKDETPATLDISIDYATFFKNVDLTDPKQRICHTMNNIPVATAVADQISSAIKIGRD